MLNIFADALLIATRQDPLTPAARSDGRDWKVEAKPKRGFLARMGFTR